MRKQLRPYQTQLLTDVRQCPGHPVAVLPTGGGKTVVFARLAAEHPGPVVAIAHRKELVAQISRGFAAEGLMHRIIAPRDTVRAICANNARAFGQPFVSPTAHAGVAGIDSLTPNNLCPTWAASVTLKIQDEGHHALSANKWGKGLHRFPAAKLVGFTATPERSDGKGLGDHADGLYTHIVRGPSMRELIGEGHLSDYRLFAPESTQLDLTSVPISKSTGDYSAVKLRDTVRTARITGDVVRHYKLLAGGQLGLTFVADVAAAEEMAEAYRAAGIPAAALSAKTPAGERADTIRRFAIRELLQLVNVDLFGEGFDLASAAGMDVCVDVVSMARPTASYTVFAQQFGRALRLPSSATVIDHVGNVARHNGPPDFPRAMTLDARDRKRSSAPDDVPRTRTCRACTGVYAIELVVCPYCGHLWAPMARDTPDDVEGDLVELDPGALAELRAAAELAIRSDDGTRAHYVKQRIPAIGVAANVKRGREQREAQELLRERIAEISGQWRAAGSTDSEIYRRFYREHRVDVATACGLKAPAALALLGELDDK